MESELHIHRIGMGERVLLLHGSTGKAGTMWEPVHSLADGFELVIPDRRGWGNSPSGTVDDLDIQVEELAKLLGEGAHLVGFSYGALLALLITGRYPNRVKSLLVHEPPVFHLSSGEDHIEEQISLLRHAFENAPNGDPAEFFFRFLKATGGNPTGPKPLTPEQQSTCLRMMQEPNSIDVEIPLDLIRTASFPKLVFSGQSLPAFTVLCRSLAKQIESEIVEIPEASHGVRHPGFTKTLGNFLADQASSPGGP